MLNNCDIIFVVGSKPPGVWGCGLLVVEDVVVVVVSPVLAVVVVPVESPEDTVVVGAAVVVAAVDPGMLGIPGMFILKKMKKIQITGGPVKPVLSDHSKIGKTNVLMTNGSLMKVESIAECSLWSILQYF